MSFGSGQLLFKYLIILGYIASPQAIASELGSVPIAPLGQRVYVVDQDPSKPSKILPNDSTATPSNAVILRDPAFLGQAKTSLMKKEDAGGKAAFSNAPRPEPSTRQSTSAMPGSNPAQRMKVFGKPLRPQIIPAELKLETSRANIPVENRILENLYHSDQDL